MKSASDDPAVLTRLGLIALRKRMHEEATELFEYALRLQPDNAGFHVNAATAWKQAGNTKKAIQYLERAIALDPSLELAYQRLGEIFLESNQPLKVRETLERYLKFNPDSFQARNALQSLAQKEHGHERQN